MTLGMRNGMILLAALALAGCGGGSEAPAPKQVDRSAGDAAAKKLLEASEEARKIAFVRAIIDTGARCDGVVKADRLEDQNKFPVWRADCKTGISHIITVTPDGQFSVLSRNDVR